jgi:Rrf2 family protein
MAQNHRSGEYITVISIAEKLGISKIYLEQVYALLKRSGLVISVKGAQGGYQLSRPPREITAFDILSAVELTLFEKPEDMNLVQTPAIEEAIKTSVMNRLDGAVESALSEVTLEQLAAEVEKNQAQGSMYYI